MENIKNLFDQFLGWLNGTGTSGFEEFTAAFNKLDWLPVMVILLTGLAFTFVGRKIFWAFYSILWAGIGFYAGFQWGENVGGGLYSYELGIFLAVLIPIAAFSARKVFAYVIGMVITMFLSLYVISSLGLVEGLSVYDPFIFIAGIVVGLAFLKTMEYLIISITTFLGSFSVSMCLKFFAKGSVDSLVQLAMVIGFFVAGFFVQVKLYAIDKERIE